MKKEKDTGTKTLKCTGCGRGKFVVNPNTKSVFCYNCFVVLGNNYRYKNNLPMYKLQPLHVGGTFTAINGKDYKIVKKSYVLHDTVFYVCKDLETKETSIMGDYNFSILEELPYDTNTKEE